MAVFASGNRLTPARLNAHGAVARRAASQSIPNSALTDVSLDTEVYDNSAMFAPTSAIITIPAGGDGLYRVKAWCEFVLHATGFRTVSISKNGGTTVGVDWWHVTRPTSSDAVQGLSISEDIPLVATNTIRMKVWHAAGVSLDLTEARLSVVRIPGA